MPTDQRLRIYITGAVQGVGFRPFIYKLAKSHDLKGFINNSSQGVLIEAEGNPAALKNFLLSIEPEKPANAVIQSLEYVYLEPAGYSCFDIQASTDTGEKTALILPDIATCSDCLRELFDPSDRRYLYPFTNCTNCGPRFTIIESLPYDRPNTTMKHFPMCENCLAEYHNPENRRFHAQPNACPVCGPHVELRNGNGAAILEKSGAIEAAVTAIMQGEIIAVKGIGGFHLLADARNEEAVRLLRERKRREEKPFAVMMPSVEMIGEYCAMSDMEKRLLTSPQAPIVLLNKKNQASMISGLVAPLNPYLGVMLPYSPLHHILMRRLNIPVIATSGNLSDEPICTDENEAMIRLNGIADSFLIHNRPIARHADDSIGRVIHGGDYLLRRARGYAPMPVLLDAENIRNEEVIAVGAHLKNAVAMNRGKRCFISQHIGDLDTPESRDAFVKVIDDLKSMYEIQPRQVVSDAHPDYASTAYARASGIEHLTLQHHVAHIVSCMAENDLEPPVLGVAWDGTGYGDDGTVWGGEFILIDRDGYRRIAHFRPFLLPGGDQAVKEPRRSAAGLLFEMNGGNWTDEPAPAMEAFTPVESAAIHQMLNRKINCILTSSAGRLFDAAASLAGVRQVCRFEGQAAMELEMLACDSDKTYPFTYSEKDQTGVIDWEPMIRGILSDYHLGEKKEWIASAFHNTLTAIITKVVTSAGTGTAALSGGCFQNKRLLESAMTALEREGIRVFRHQRIPSNDGGIALGQITAALRFPYLLKRPPR